MFCMQCEQTISTPAVKGCVFAQGMCGKTAEVSDLQDILVRYLQGISFWAKLGADYGFADNEINRWCAQAFFSTLTNVNFDPARIYEFINEAKRNKDSLEKQVRDIVVQKQGSIPQLTAAASLAIPTGTEAVIQFAPNIALNHNKDKVDDVLGAYLLRLYG